MDESSVADYIITTFPGVETSELDTIMPHPDYAPQNFICVLSPGEATLAQVRALLAEAYEIAVQRNTRRSKKPENE